MPSEPDQAQSVLDEARAGLTHLRQVPGFRRFVLARVFLLTITLSIPYFSLYGRDITGAQVGNLGVFVIALSLAEIVSSPFWGRFADRSARTVMLLGSALAALVSGLAMAFPLLPASLQTAPVFGAVILLLGFGRAGVRLGRKTYLVDGAPPDERPLYAAITNTILGLFTLVGSAFGLLHGWIGTQALIGVFGGLALIGALLVWRLPEAPDMVR
jgi:predicted MFS family arabinose efflux permease